MKQLIKFLNFTIFLLCFNTVQLLKMKMHIYSGVVINYQSKSMCGYYYNILVPVSTSNVDYRMYIDHWETCAEFEEFSFSQPKNQSDTTTHRLLSYLLKTLIEKGRFTMEPILDSTLIYTVNYDVMMQNEYFEVLNKKIMDELQEIAQKQYSDVFVNGFIYLDGSQTNSFTTYITHNFNAEEGIINNRPLLILNSNSMILTYEVNNDVSIDSQYLKSYKLFGKTYYIFGFISICNGANTIIELVQLELINKYMEEHFIKHLDSSAANNITINDPCSCNTEESVVELSSITLKCFTHNPYKLHDKLEVTFVGAFDYKKCTKLLIEAAFLNKIGSHNISGMVDGVPSPIPSIKSHHTSLHIRAEYIDGDVATYQDIESYHEKLTTYCQNFNPNLINSKNDDEDTNKILDLDTEDEFACAKMIVNKNIIDYTINLFNIDKKDIEVLDEEAKNREWVYSPQLATYQPSSYDPNKTTSFEPDLFPYSKTHQLFESYMGIKVSFENITYKLYIPVLLFAFVTHLIIFGIIFFFTCIPNKRSNPNVYNP